ncbi:MAG TPA: glycosyltransferase family 39 protein [Gemmatimonadales bacterium]|nr:glycosyltransferase family 39 protein [Gemmatimonadales bacterium]
MSPSGRDALVVVGLWIIVLGVALAGRPLLSPDETRYLGVAWDMWARHDFLVPHLNGLPYSDKPPLLFWLFHLGWAVGGVSELWPRLIGPACALGSAFLLISVARRLWPGRPGAGWAAMVALPGTLGWVTYGGLILFDMLLTVGVLVALLGVLVAWRGRRLSGWSLFGFGVGFALLAKGPPALIHILPIPLLAPWWMRDDRPARWQTWYAGLGVAFFLGVAMVLAWAVPAGNAGGAAYRDAIFLHQVADRMVSGAAHARPIWWYLPVVPLLLLPWILWPPAWRAIADTRRHLDDSGVRLCLTWLAVTFACFSLVRGKQAHYLLPLVPALALLWDAGWRTTAGAGKRAGAAVPAIFLVLAGLTLLAAPRLHALTDRNPWVASLPAWPAGLLLLAAAAAVLLGRRLDTRQLPLLVSGIGLTGAALLEVAVFPAMRPQFDVAPLAAALQVYQARGFAIGHVGKYNAQWQFAGRMTTPIDVVADLREGTAWMERHPRHVLIHYVRSADGPEAIAAGEQCSPYRDRLACLIVADSTGGSQRARDGKLLTRDSTP